MMTPADNASAATTADLPQRKVKKGILDVFRRVAPVGKIDDRAAGENQRDGRLRVPGRSRENHGCADTSEKNRNGPIHEPMPCIVA